MVFRYIMLLVIVGLCVGSGVVGNWLAFVGYLSCIFLQVGLMVSELHIRLLKSEAITGDFEVWWELDGKKNSRFMSFIGMGSNKYISQWAWLSAKKQTLDKCTADSGSK